MGGPSFLTRRRFLWPALAWVVPAPYYLEDQTSNLSNLTVARITARRYARTRARAVSHPVAETLCQFSTFFHSKGCRGSRQLQVGTHRSGQARGK